jgi:ABC-type Fe3+ transport system substrate-binding protein
MAAPMAKTQPGWVAFVNPNPLPVSLNLTDAGRNASHAADALLFDDWLISPTGQQKIIGLSDDTATRTYVRNDASAWNPEKWAPALSPDAYNTELAEMKSALNVA